MPRSVFAQLCLRTWLKTLRRPVILSFSFVQPLLWMLLFGFLFQRYPVAGDLATHTYLDYLAPGVSAMTVLFGASQSGVALIRDWQSGFLARMLHTPTRTETLLGGKLFADVVRLIVQAALVLVLGVVVGAHLRPTAASLPAATLALCLFAFAFSALSCSIALLARTQEGMAVFVHLVNMPVLFTSSALVPKQHMPDWLATIASWNPLTLAVDLWRAALLGGEVATPLRSIVALAIFALVMFGVGTWAMRQAARHA